jgi:hypothetical protein
MITKTVKRNHIQLLSDDRYWFQELEYFNCSPRRQCCFIHQFDKFHQLHLPFSTPVTQSEGKRLIHFQEGFRSRPLFISSCSIEVGLSLNSHLHNSNEVAWERKSVLYEMRDQTLVPMTSTEISSLLLPS